MGRNVYRLDDNGLVNPNGPLDDYVCYLLGGVQLSWWEANLCE
jgi:hypothetical protein